MRGWQSIAPRLADTIPRGGPPRSHRGGHISTLVDRTRGFGISAATTAMSKIVRRRAQTAMEGFPRGRNRQCGIWRRRLARIGLTPLGRGSLRRSWLPPARSDNPRTAGDRPPLLGLAFAPAALAVGGQHLDRSAGFQPRLGEDRADIDVVRAPQCLKGHHRVVGILRMVQSFAVDEERLGVAAGNRLGGGQHRFDGIGDVVRLVIM